MVMVLWSSVHCKNQAPYKVANLAVFQVAQEKGRMLPKEINGAILNQNLGSFAESTHY